MPGLGKSLEQFLDGAEVCSREQSHWASGCLSGQHWILERGPHPHIKEYNEIVSNISTLEVFTAEKTGFAPVCSCDLVREASHCSLLFSRKVFEEDLNLGTRKLSI